MLKIDIISALPDLLESPLSHSIIQRAIDKQKVEIRVHDLRNYSTDKHHKIDDYPYGGGAGMVMTPQPIFDCIEKLTSENSCDEIIFTAPDGELFQQKDANELSLKKHLIFLCGHYKGVDQRVRDQLVTKEYSVGDVVLSGGEIPVLMMTDAIVRLLPGVLGDAESALTDSFQDGLLEPPLYTRPSIFRDASVPDVLLSGNHEKIEQWRKQRAEERTKEKRPDLYELYNKKN